MKKLGRCECQKSSLNTELNIKGEKLITNPILTMVVKFNPHEIAAKTTEVDDKQKSFWRWKQDPQAAPDTLQWYKGKNARTGFF